MHENQSETRMLTVSYQAPPQPSGDSGGSGGGSSRGSRQIKPVQTVAAPIVPIIYAPFPLISTSNSKPTEQSKTEKAPEATGAVTAESRGQRTPLQAFVSLDTELIKQELRRFFELVREKAKELFGRIKDIISGKI